MVTPEVAQADSLEDSHSLDRMDAFGFGLFSAEWDETNKKAFYRNGDSQIL